MLLQMSDTASRSRVGQCEGLGALTQKPQSYRFDMTFEGIRVQGTRGTYVRTIERTLAAQVDNAVDSSLTQSLRIGITQHHTPRGRIIGW